MIHCAQCGTENRDGSKFCSNCGARLAQPSGLVCPMCSTPNKVESVFCSNCGARLVPLIVAPAPEKPQPVQPIKGLSLPTKPPPAPETPAAKEAPSPAPAPAEQVPSSDWLERLRTTTAEEEVSSAALRPAEEEVPSVPGKPTAPSSESLEELPDWLRTPPSDLQKPSAPSAPPAEQPAPIPPEEQSAWLQRLREATVSVDEIPEWLKKADVQPTAEESAPAVPVEEPSWLKPAEPGVLPRVPISPTETTVPEWLKGAKPEPGVEEAKPATAEEAKPGEPLVEALEAVAPPTLAPTAPLPTWLTEMPVSTEEEEIPDWLRTPIPVGEPGAPLIEIPVEPAPSAVEPAAPGEVPDWVTALKPAELALPFAELEKESVESSGPLAGLRGVLPLATAIVEPHATKKLTTPTAPHKEGARAFESILAAPVPSTAAPVAKKARRAWTIRPLIYLLIALAVVIPFFISFDLFGLAVPITGGVSAEDFVRVVEGLPANSTVLVSFDYDPGLSGEMDLVASAIVRHLVKHRVRIIAVSTMETGPQIAQRILGKAAREAGNYAYGTDYLIIGYLPGNEAALATLATQGLPGTAKDLGGKDQAIGNFSITANVKTLRDVQLVIELAGTEDALKMWMEQVQPRTSARVVAGVSAAVEPKARAYRNARQLTALVSGLVGAAQYEVLSGQSGLAVISVNAQTAAQLALVVIVVLGNIVYWMRKLQRARGKAA